jgi:RNA 3'-terminal phosphate cyclase (ATP)
LALTVARRRQGGVACFTCIEISHHARTQMDVIEAFLPVRFTVQAEANGQRVTVTADQFSAMLSRRR